MTELFLIAHCVRGEAAFDVALQMECPECEGKGIIIRHIEWLPCPECDGQGFWWIIPTSGHRAFPYWSCDLNDWLGIIADTKFSVPSMPPSWPDHYRHGPSPKVDIMSLFKAHRKDEPKPHIQRRL